MRVTFYAYNHRQAPSTAATMAAESTGATFSAALSTWRGAHFLSHLVHHAHERQGINLGELQKTLDKQGIEIVENQKENMVGRKRLAEQTRGALSLPILRLRMPVERAQTSKRSQTRKRSTRSRASSKVRSRPCPVWPLRVHISVQHISPRSTTSLAGQSLPKAPSSMSTSFSPKRQIPFLSLTPPSCVVPLHLSCSPGTDGRTGSNCAGVRSETTRIRAGEAKGRERISQTAARRCSEHREGEEEIGRQGRKV